VLLSTSRLFASNYSTKYFWRLSLVQIAVSEWRRPMHWRRQLYGALGHNVARAPSTSDCLSFRSLQSRTNPDIVWLETPRGFLSNKNILQAYSFVTVYCMNFIIGYFCVSPLNYFIKVSCPCSHRILATPLFVLHPEVWNIHNCSLNFSRVPQTDNPS